MNCPYCSASVPENKTTCPACGASVPRTDQPYPWIRAAEKLDDPGKKKIPSRRVLIAVGGALGALALLLVTVLSIVPAVRSLLTRQTAEPTEGVSAAEPITRDERDTGACIPEESTTEEETETETETEPPELNLLPVDPVSGQVRYLSDDRNDRDYVGGEAGQEYFDCYLPYEEDERIRYLAYETGNYLIVPDLFDDDAWVDLTVINDYGEIEEQVQLWSGDRYSVLMGENEEYVFVFSSSSFSGPFQVRIDSPKTIGDVSDYAAIHDDLSFYLQENGYLFYPDVSGEYTFRFTEIPDPMTVSFFILNENGDEICAMQYLEQGDGVSVQLEEDGCYLITVWQTEDFGGYTMQIERPQLAEDVSGCTEVIHRISRPGQINSYYYTAAEPGVYSFRIKDPENDARFSMSVYEDGTELLQKTDLTAGDGLTLTLDAGTRYLVQVGQYSGVGAYSLKIDPQKPAADLTGYDLAEDSFEFIKQTNYYTYTAPADGMFTFGVDSMPYGMRVFMAVYNENDDQIAHGVSLAGGAYIKAALESGKTYRIEVRQDSGTGGYLLKIEKPAGNRQSKGD